MLDKIVFLVGPTAVGKTEVSVILAKKLNAEIISCDSMQIYKGIDIIVSKPGPNLRKKIPHHLINLVPFNKEYDVSRYRKEAVRKVREIIKKGKIPLFVGGTGLYISVLIDGIFEVKAKAKIKIEQIRKRLYGQLEKIGRLRLYERLRTIDPIAARKIHPRDAKRIIRALEVYYATGKSISELQKQRRGLRLDYDIKIFCLNMPRDRLYKRIDERAEKMFQQGAVVEVKGLLKKKLSRTVLCAIGIKEIKGYLDGLYDLEEAKRLIRRNTRHFAKRQLTWFRKDKRIKWIEIDREEKPIETANRILNKLRGAI